MRILMPFAGFTSVLLPSSEMIVGSRKKQGVDRSNGRVLGPGLERPRHGGLHVVTITR